MLIIEIWISRHSKNTYNLLQISLMGTVSLVSLWIVFQVDCDGVHVSSAAKWGFCSDDCPNEKWRNAEESPLSQSDGMSYRICKQYNAT